MQSCQSAVFAQGLDVLLDAIQLFILLILPLVRIYLPLSYDLVTSNMTVSTGKKNGMKFAANVAISTPSC